MKSLVPTSSRSLRSLLSAWVLCLFMFAIALVRSARLEDSYNTPKIMLMFVFCAAMVALIKSECRLPSQIRRPGALFLIWVVCGPIIYAMSYALVQFALFTWLLLGVVFICSADSIKRPSDVFRVFGWMVAAGVVTALWTVFEDVTHGRFSSVVSRLPDWRGYLSAGLGNSGHIAGLMGYLLPGMVVLFLASRKLNWWLFAAMVAMASAFVVTWSVGSAGSALVAVAAVLAFCAVTNLRTQLHWRRLLPLAAVAVVTAAFWLLPHALNPHPQGLWNEAFSSNRWHEGWPTRVAIWETTWSIIKSHPIVGVGVGNFQYAFVQQVVPSLQESPELAVWAGAFTNDAHNEFLHIWAEQGIVGLVVALWILGVYAVAVWRIIASKKNHLGLRLAGLVSAGAVLAFVLDSMMTFPLRLPAHAVWFMFFLAVPFALSRKITVVAIPLKNRLWGLFFCLLLGWLILGPRVVAEYNFKAGRELADMPVHTGNGRYISLWEEGANAMSMAIQATADGDTTATKYHLGKARYYAAQPTVQLGAELFQKAAESDRAYSNVLSRYSQYLLMKHEVQLAIEYYEKTYALLAASEIPLNHGFALYLDGQTTRAAELWRTAGERRPPLKPLTDALIRSTADKPFAGL